MSAVRDALVRVRELLREPSAWTQGVTARDANGAPTKAHSPDARRWCLAGGVDKVSAHLSLGLYDSVWNRVDRAARAEFEMSAIHVNDTLSHEDVLDLLDAAIAKESDK